MTFTIFTYHHTFHTLFHLYEIWCKLSAHNTLYHLWVSLKSVQGSRTFHQTIHEITFMHVLLNCVIFGQCIHGVDHLQSCYLMIYVIKDRGIYFFGDLQCVSTVIILWCCTVRFINKHP